MLLVTMNCTLRQRKRNFQSGYSLIGFLATFHWVTHVADSDRVSNE